jgi:hypothetical protein
VDTAGGREDLAQERTESIGVDVTVAVVGTDQLSPTLDGDPLPAGPKREADLGASTQVGQLCSAVGDETDHLGAHDRMRQNARVDDRGLDRGVGSKG